MLGERIANYYQSRNIHVSFDTLGGTSQLCSTYINEIAHILNKSSTKSSHHNKHVCYSQYFEFDSRNKSTGFESIEEMEYQFRESMSMLIDSTTIDQQVFNFTPKHFLPTHTTKYKQLLVDLLSSYTRPIIYYSGGLDSEFVLMAAMEARLYYTPVVFRWIGDDGKILNAYDLSYVDKFCNRHELIPVYLDLDIVELWNTNEFRQFATAIQCSSPQIATQAYLPTIVSKIFPNRPHLFGGEIRAKMGDDIIYATTTKAANNSSGDLFGKTVATYGNYIAVGAPGDAYNKTASGSIQIYQNQNGTWTPSQKLGSSTADELANIAMGNFSIDMDATTLVAGARPDSTTTSGKAYIYALEGGQWVYKKRLDDPLAGSNYYGIAVAVDAGTLAVGANTTNNSKGVVHLYTGSGSSWNLQTTMQPPITVSGTMYFGNGIDIRGNVMVVGAPSADMGAGIFSGALFTYFKSGNNWIWNNQTLVGSNLMAQSHFGERMCLSEDGQSLVVGAFGQPSMQVKGAAYVYTRIGDTWGNEQQLIPSDGTQYVEMFGRAVAIYGNTILVGCRVDNDTVAGGGSVYKFVKSGSQWVQQDEIRITGGATSNDQFGYGLALGANVIAIGAPYRDLNGTDSGAINIIPY